MVAIYLNTFAAILLLARASPDFIIDRTENALSSMSLTAPKRVPPVIQKYRDLLNQLSKDTLSWASAARDVREWMQANDPDYPLYHLVAPEGWVNDPNGITFDPHTNLYHRFYQYDPTYSETKSHATGVPRTWGHTVSRDLVTWEDWPGIYADTPWDEHGVFSGNCVFNGTDPNPICIYSNNPCNIGVCATSKDGWVTWEKRACMTHAPSPQSQVNHDTSIWRESDTGKWFLLIGGCTFNAPNSGRDPNVPSPNHTQCLGNAQLWTSPNLQNFTYVGPLTPGGPGGYWELPYLLPYDSHGNAIDNYHHEMGSQYVLAFGLGNSYWVGSYDRRNHSFVPAGASTTGNPPWPVPYLSDTPYYYSINPHAFDNRGPNGTVRRLVFGWVQGQVSDSVQKKIVPYWQGGHSLLRVMTVRGNYVVQEPVAELQNLREVSSQIKFGPTVVTPASKGMLPGVRGDALEIIATFDLNATSAPEFGVVLRVHPNDTSTKVYIAYCPSTRSFGVKQGSLPGCDWFAGMSSQSGGPSRATLHIFLDRSIIEVYSGGAAATYRVFLAPNLAKQALGVDLWASGHTAQLHSFRAWVMRSMWGNTTAIYV